MKVNRSLKREKKLVVTTFYANGKAIWIAEYPTQLSDEQIKQNVAELKDMGRGIVDTFTDTTGRMVKV